MKIYGISGLGADERVFDFLKLRYPIETLQWITPLKNESISKYALRLSEKIDTTKPFCLIAVSFGGLIATEICKHIFPTHSFVISSIATKDELPFLYKFVGKTGILNLLPKFFFKPPIFILNFLFAAKNKLLLAQIIRDTDATFAKWATQQLCTWKNEIEIKNCTRIHGDLDRLFPLQKFSNSTTIKDGHHFMIVDKADEISKAVNFQLNKIV